VLVFIIVTTLSNVHLSFEFKYVKQNIYNIL
jgi:hypothetical protein